MVRLLYRHKLKSFACEILTLGTQERRYVGETSCWISLQEPVLLHGKYGWWRITGIVNGQKHVASIQAPAKVHYSYRQFLAWQMRRNIYTILQGTSVHWTDLFLWSSEHILLWTLSWSVPWSCYPQGKPSFSKKIAKQSQLDARQKVCKSIFITSIWW